MNIRRRRKNGRELILGGKDEDKGLQRNEFYYQGLESVGQKTRKNLVWGENRGNGGGVTERPRYYFNLLIYTLFTKNISLFTHKIKVVPPINQAWFYVVASLQIALFYHDKELSLTFLSARKRLLLLMKVSGLKFITGGLSAMSHARCLERPPQLPALTGDQ